MYRCSQIVRRRKGFECWAGLSRANPKGAKFIKTSVHNAFKGRVKALVRGTVKTKVVVEVSEGVKVIAVMTKVSADRLNLAGGRAVQPL